MVFCDVRHQRHKCSRTVVHHADTFFIDDFFHQPVKHTGIDGIVFRQNLNHFRLKLLKAAERLIDRIGVKAMDSIISSFGLQILGKNR